MDFESGLLLVSPSTLDFASVAQLTEDIDSSPSSANWDMNLTPADISGNKISLSVLLNQDLTLYINIKYREHPLKTNLIA